MTPRVVPRRRPPQAKQVPAAVDAGRWCSVILEKLRGAYSDNTLRCYASDFRIFRAWCVHRGASFLPAAPNTLCRFIENQARLFEPATVRRRLVAISCIQRLCGFDDPMASEDVRLTLRRMQRLHGKRQKQA